MAGIILKGRLDGIQRNRLKSLFDMMYSPKELAEEIGINTDQVYMVYVPLGCPHEREERNNHLLINGKAFAEWYCTVYAKLHIKPNETFCKTCRKPVKIYQPKKHTKGDIVYLLSVCPICNRKLTKIIEHRTRGK